MPLRTTTMLAAMSSGRQATSVSAPRCAKRSLQAQAARFRQRPGGASTSAEPTIVDRDSQRGSQQQDPQPSTTASMQSSPFSFCPLRSPCFLVPAMEPSTAGPVSKRQLFEKQPRTPAVARSQSARRFSQQIHGLLPHSGTRIGILEGTTLKSTRPQERRPRTGFNRAQSFWFRSSAGPQRQWPARRFSLCSRRPHRLSAAARTGELRPRLLWPAAWQDRPIAEQPCGSSLRWPPAPPCRLGDEFVETPPGHSAMRMHPCEAALPMDLGSLVP